MFTTLAFAQYQLRTITEGLKAAATSLEVARRKEMRSARSQRHSLRAESNCRGVKSAASQPDGPSQAACSPLSGAGAGANGALAQATSDAAGATADGAAAAGSSGKYHPELPALRRQMDGSPSLDVRQQQLQRTLALLRLELPLVTPQFIDSLADVVLQRLPDMATKDLSLVLWSLAKLQHQNVGAFDAIAEEMSGRQMQLTQVCRATPISGTKNSILSSITTS